jgi:hypothetical protein
MASPGAQQASMTAALFGIGLPDINGYTTAAKRARAMRRIP